METISRIKESMCIVAQDFDAEMKGPQEHNEIDRVYKLPGDKLLTLKEERLKCPEVLFQPN
jgi:hypothetical protein